MDKALHTITWEEVCADPCLQDLPYKIELNALNQIVMAPANARHSMLQSEISRLLTRLLKGGKAIVELATETADSVKVPDVVWAARATIQARRGEASWSRAAEICVEVLSLTNTKAEIDGKRALYFERGAREVWVCDHEGRLRFYAPAGELKRSTLCPKFPLRIKV